MGSTLMYRAADLIVAQRGDHPLDLSPMAEAKNVASVPALLGADCRFIARIASKAINQFMRVPKGSASCDEEAVHSKPCSLGAFRLVPTKSVNAPFTTSRLVYRPGVWQSAAMQTRSSMAGGFLLIVCLFAGLIVGVRMNQPSLGVLLGTLAGALVAVAVWVFDRRRRD